MRMRHVTGKGARVPGPNPNASYKLRYTPPEGSDERETSFAITGAHLHKTWKSYRERVDGDPPVWDPDFVSEAMLCVLHREAAMLSVGYTDLCRWMMDGEADGGLIVTYRLAHASSLISEVHVSG